MGKFNNGLRLLDGQIVVLLCVVVTNEKLSVKLLMSGLKSGLYKTKREA